MSSSSAASCGGLQAQALLPRAGSSTEITLRGSVEIVTEFFGYAVNSILYQRGVYPPESFVPASKYGLTTMVTGDEALRIYLASVLRQLAGWLAAGLVQKLVVAVAGAESKETRERWVFHVSTDKAALAPGCVVAKPSRHRGGKRVRAARANKAPLPPPSLASASSSRRAIRRSRARSRRSSGRSRRPSPSSRCSTRPAPLTCSSTLTTRRRCR